MLEGFVPFPEEFVTRYKQKGYWIDKTLGEEFDSFASKYADRILGEKGCAFVLTKPDQDLTLDELCQFLRDERNIAVFKLPERLEFVIAFPMTEVGKIDKKELRRIVSEKLE